MEERASSSSIVTEASQSSSSMEASASQSSSSIVTEASQSSSSMEASASQSSSSIETEASQSSSSMEASASQSSSSMEAEASQSMEAEASQSSSSIEASASQSSSSMETDASQSSSNMDAETSKTFSFEEMTQNLSYADLDVFPDFLTERSTEIKNLQLDHNEIMILPRSISFFTNLVILDISYNNLTYINPEFVRLQHLRTFSSRNNRLDVDSLPKDMGLMQSLRVINLSGNRLQKFPMQFTELTQLKCLQLGANNIAEIPAEISSMKRLEVLYLGGNKLTELPDEIGHLRSLVSLYLCDNQLQSLPRSMAGLRHLESLSLHNNQLSTLPPELIKLNLVELSLRNNPLVVRFVQEMVNHPPSLLELTGRVIKAKNIHYGMDDLPRNLIEYLGSAQSCVNPKCKGVYFTSRFEHVKFVDFCGKYRLPLLEYLCSSRCTTSSPIMYISSESESEDELPVISKMRKVLLG